MSYFKNHQLSTYCGLNSEQAADFLKLYKGEIIHQNRFSGFVGGGLIRRGPGTGKQAHTVTNIGFVVLDRIRLIQQGTFSAEKAEFLDEELSALSNNVTRLARLDMPKSYGLRSEHLKALIATARQPGIVVCALLNVYAADAVGLLISRDLVGSRDAAGETSAKHNPLYLYVKGQTLLTWCLDKVKLAGE